MKRKYVNREKILKRDGYLCGYCFEESATEVDHIIPVSYKDINSEDNLIASCSTCNGIASNFIFESLEEKRQYIQSQRKLRHIKPENDLFPPLYLRRIDDDELRIDDSERENDDKRKPVVTKSPVIKTETIKIIREIVPAKISGVELKALRLYLQQSLTEFGVILKRKIDPKTEYPFTRAYIHALENNKSRITPAIEAAYWEIKEQSERVPVGLSGAVLVKMTVLPNGQDFDGAFIPRSAKVVRCATPGCSVLFVKTHPRQKYHDPECNEARRNGRGKEKVKA